MSRKIHSGDIKEVNYDKMKINVYTDGHGFDEK
jgi:hypothetical protein